MDYFAQYRAKLRTADQAVACVKSGDWVDYTTSLGMPVLLDQALARRRDELREVKLRGNLLLGPIACVECDPSQQHFVYNSWHCSAYERRLADKGLCFYIPMIFRNLSAYYHHFLTVNVAMVAARPMGRHGFFNLSVAAGASRGVLDKADLVIVEVNEHLPRVHGVDEIIHISEVDYVVEGEHDPLPTLGSARPTAEDELIASHIMPYIHDGSALQLGIGGLPNAVGKRLAAGGIRDLSMHTELCCDAYLELYRSGVLTNSKSHLQRNKGVYGIALGSKELYDWIDDNPGLHVCPLSYVNSTEVISQLDNMISVNSCVSCDLYGQVNAESSGIRQISGTGGQLDYLTGAAQSKGGKAFLCMTSTYTDRDGKRRSRIVPFFTGDIVTSPRSQAYFIVTEYGAANLVGRSTWERAEMLINLAHPDYREALIQAAQAQRIWRLSNKRPPL